MAANNSGFRQAILEWTPWYLKGFWGARLLESLGSVLDGFAETVDEGRRAVNPLLSQEDALPFFSKDRQIQLYSTEPAASKRFRLSRSWQLHQRQGTALGLMEHAQPYFLDQAALPRMRVVHTDAAYLRSTWWTRNANGSTERYVKSPANWNWDGTNLISSQRWARSWVIIYTAGTALDSSCARYDDGTTFDDGLTVYDGISTQARSDLIALLKSWRAAHEQIWGIALAHDQASFDPTSTVVTLGDGTTTLPDGNWLYPVDATTNKATRLQSADWIYDRTRDGA